jgi:DNA replication protein DnaC
MTAEGEKVARRCAAEDVDHLGSLLQLCEPELIERQRRAARRRLKAARSPAIKTLEGFDFAAAPTPNKPLALELARCDFVERREDLLLIGGPGPGEMHPATALGVEACGRGERVRFHRVTEPVTQLLGAREGRPPGRLRSRPAKRGPLILDGPGPVPASEAGAELLFGAIGTAYER